MSEQNVQVVNNAEVVYDASNDPIDQMWAQIQERKKRDFVSPRNRLRMNYDPNAERYEIDLGGEFTFPVNDYAREQLNTSEAPGFMPYARWLDANGRIDSYLNNVNDLLERDKRKAMIRTVENPGEDARARAFLSDAFKPIDDDIVFETALNVIGKHGHAFKSIGGKRTDVNSAVKIVSREPTFSLSVGGRVRDFSIGFMMRNSEVGRGYAAFTAFFTDHYCDNGCVFSREVVADMKHMHRGSRISTEFGELMGDRIQMAELEAIRSTIIQAAEIACGNEHQAKVEQLIRLSAERRINGGNEVRAIEQICQKVGVSKMDAEMVKVGIDHMSQFGVQAAITALAQNAPSYDKRLELEEAGGKVLAMTEKTWDAVNKLAA